MGDSLLEMLQERDLNTSREGTKKKKKKEIDQILADHLSDSFTFIYFASSTIMYSMKKHGYPRVP